MRVEWYSEDLSDPEAVSGSSTNLYIKAPKMGVFCMFKINERLKAACQNYVFRKNKKGVQKSCGKLDKNDIKNCSKNFRKIIDISFFMRYYRGSF